MIESRYKELLPLFIEAMADENLIMASGAVELGVSQALFANARLASIIVDSDAPHAVMAIHRRTLQPRRPAAWWKERSQGLHLETMDLPWFALSWIVSNSGAMPYGDVWGDLLRECLWLCKVNHEAELSVQERMPFPILRALTVVRSAAGDEARHNSILADSAIVDALTYAVAHDYNIAGMSTASYGAQALVALIGRNEEGLTLSREAVGYVVETLSLHFDPITTFFKVSARKVVKHAKSVADVVIADANKPFVLENTRGMDALVTGLLVDDGNPRRTQDGADELQAACALALQNLALSEASRPPLRAHSGVMQSLRKVATVEGGLSEEARQYASGALFELDEVARQKAKEAAVAAKVADGDDSGEAGDEAEHVMLSYNWGHQDTIKRVNLALQARGYAVWIDIEKMQGSTVEAMSAAVEDAAVMCYGVSQAYKESTNCRMEAQYAFQQQKDMIPLMLEDGYRAKGWLGMMLGVRLWYGFYGSVLESEDAFEVKMDELCREVGARGKV